MHENAKISQCDICGRICESKRLLQDHIDSVHIKLMNLNCKDCDKRFALERQLKSHVQKIHAEKEYECDTCNLKFARKCAWKRHALVHSGLLVECDICFKKFRESTLITHKRHHQITERIQCKSLKL